MAAGGPVHGPPRHRGRDRDFVPRLCRPETSPLSPSIACIIPHVYERMDWRIGRNPPTSGVNEIRFAPHTNRPEYRALRGLYGPPLANRAPIGVSI